jgi:hypothetical protein
MGILSKKTADIPRRRFNDQARPAANPQDNLFRRGRTLTGSTSNVINTTHPDTNLQSPRTRAHQLSSIRRRVGGILLITVAVAVVLFWVLNQFTAQISVTTNDTSLTKPLDSKRYDQAIEKYLESNPIARLRFALNESDLSAYLARTVPEVASVTNQSGFGLGTTTFTLQMRKPVAGWQIDSNQFFVDSQGVAFQQNYYADPTVQIVDNSGVSLQQGSAVTSSRFLSFVGRIVAESQQQGYVVTQAILPIGTTRELEIHLQNVVPTVRLSIDRPAGEQAEDMARALRYLAGQGKTPGYIDVRVSGKAYYQ